MQCISAMVATFLVRTYVESPSCFMLAYVFHSFQVIDSHRILLEGWGCYYRSRDLVGWEFHMRYHYCSHYGLPGTFNLSVLWEMTLTRASIALSKEKQGVPTHRDHVKQACGPHY